MISVCMTTYNGEKFIIKQINSILSQLNSDDELIISDDGSTDRTVEIIRDYNDSRIKLVNHNKGNIKTHKTGMLFYLVTANFENALTNAQGDYIFLSDQDDIWMPNKVHLCLEKLKHSDFVQSNFNIIDSNDTIKVENFLTKNPIQGGILKTILVSKMQGCTMAFNRCVLEKALPFPKDLMLHDAWLGVVAKKYGTTEYINQSLINYRRTDKNVSTSTKESNNTLFFRIFYRLKILYQISKR